MLGIGQQPVLEHQRPGRQRARDPLHALVDVEQDVHSASPHAWVPIRQPWPTAAVSASTQPIGLPVQVPEVI